VRDRRADHALGAGRRDWGYGIPAEIKKRLGLDGERSWAVLTESNTFNWPGPDLRPIGGSADGSIAYGTLPPNFIAELRKRFLELERSQRSRRIVRTE
jgi:hypothetical protein